MRSNYFRNEEQKHQALVRHMLGHCISMIENHIHPVYVFDGIAPIQKQEIERKRRQKAREQIQKKLDIAREEGNTAEIRKYEKQVTSLTPNDVSAVRRMFEVLGVPYIDAPAEAEAQCSYLAKEGLVDFVASEDTDCFPFHCPKLVRHFNISSHKACIVVTLHKILEGFEMSYEQFVDLCILVGCDFAEYIPRIGPKTAYNLIKQHGNIETVLENIGTKYAVPENWGYIDARELFINHAIKDTAAEDIEFRTPRSDESELMLIGEYELPEFEVKDAIHAVQNQCPQQTTEIHESKPIEQYFQEHSSEELSESCMKECASQAEPTSEAANVNEAEHLDQNNDDLSMITDGETVSLATKVAESSVVRLDEPPFKKVKSALTMDMFQI